MAGSGYTVLKSVGHTTQDSTYPLTGIRIFRTIRNDWVHCDKSAVNKLVTNLHSGSSLAPATDKACTELDGVAAMRS
jgi:hypothetical protein